MDRQPKHPFHPGAVLLEEFLKPQGITQAEFSSRIGWTQARLNELIRGKRGISAGKAARETLSTTLKICSCWFFHSARTHPGLSSK